MGFHILLRSTAVAAASDNGFTMILSCVVCEKSVNGGWSFHGLCKFCSVLVSRVLSSELCIVRNKSRERWMMCSSFIIIVLK